MGKVLNLNKHGVAQYERILTKAEHFGAFTLATDCEGPTIVWTSEHIQKAAQKDLDIEKLLTTTANSKALPIANYWLTTVDYMGYQECYPLFSASEFGHLIERVLYIKIR